jgi:hypothetical protein
MTGTAHCIFEDVQLSPSTTVDRDRAVIPNVKLLGFSSKNNREYPKNVLEKAASLYEGAEVNIDHNRLNVAERGVRDNFGFIKNVRMSDDGLRADIHYYETHQDANFIIERIEKAPTKIGLSHAAEAITKRSKGKTLVEEINKVWSVDLVSRPATTNGIFESENPSMDPTTTTKPDMGGENAEPSMPQDGTVQRVEAIFAAMEQASPEQLSEIEAVLGLSQTAPQSPTPVAESLRIAKLEVENQLLKRGVTATETLVEAIASASPTQRNTLIESMSFSHSVRLKPAGQMSQAKPQEEFTNMLNKIKGGK